MFIQNCNLRKKMQLGRLMEQNNGDGGGAEPPVEPTIVDLQKQIIVMQQQQNKLIEDNKNLSTMNQELFLKVTGKGAEKNKEQNVNAEYEEYVGKEYFNSLTPKQQKLLIEILEGEDE